MKLGILSDIHANLEALEAVLSFLKEKVEKLIVVGDVLGYGPDPNECLKILTRQKATFVKGNHEAGLLSGDLSKFHKSAALSLKWTREKIEADWLGEIKAWSEELIKNNTCFVHGSPDNKLFGYINTSKQAEKSLSLLNSPVCFHGHTHFPVAFRKQISSPRIEKLPADFGGRLTIQIEQDYLYLIDIGSVGQPRDGLPDACASIYDSEKKIFQLTRIPYPVEITGNKIVKSGLPSNLADRLRHGL